jgi:hypothetical protein
VDLLGFRTAQFEATSRESDPRPTADAPGAPGRILCAGARRAAIKNPRREASRVPVFDVSLRFAKETNPASTVLIVRAEVRFVLRVVVLF